MKKINLSTTKQSNSVRDSSAAPEKIISVGDEKINYNQQLLLQSAPGKLLYSIRETAKVLGVSYEFIREKIYAGRVMAKAFGSRKLIHVLEVSRLLTEGLAA